MKSNVLLSSILSVLVAAFSLSANAAEADKGTDTKAATTDTKSTKSSDAAMKRHSHATEKSGVPLSQQVAPESSGEKTPATDTSKHYHPRDGK